MFKSWVKMTGMDDTKTDTANEPVEADDNGFMDTGILHDDKPKKNLESKKDEKDEAK